MKKLLVAFLILFMVASPAVFSQSGPSRAVPQTTLQWAGHEWVNLDPGAKVSVVFGYVTAMHVVQITGVYLRNQDSIDSNSIDFLLRLSRFNAPVGNIVQAVDRYYARGGEHLDAPIWQIIQGVVGNNPDYVFGDDLNPFESYTPEKENREEIEPMDPNSPVFRGLL